MYCYLRILSATICLSRFVHSRYTAVFVSNDVVAAVYHLVGTLSPPKSSTGHHNLHSQHKKYPTTYKTVHTVSQTLAAFQSVSETTQILLREKLIEFCNLDIVVHSLGNMLHAATLPRLSR